MTGKRAWVSLEVAELVWEGSGKFKGLGQCGRGWADLWEGLGLCGRGHVLSGLVWEGQGRFIMV